MAKTRSSASAAADLTPPPEEAADVTEPTTNAVATAEAAAETPAADPADTPAVPPAEPRPLAAFAVTKVNLGGRYYEPGDHLPQTALERLGELPVGELMNAGAIEIREL